MNKEYLTTFEAARRMSVTPDSVLKWIKSGLLEAHRTPGGHHRIAVKSIEKLQKKSRRSTRSAKRERKFEYCWEFYARFQSCGMRCEDCIVYQTSAKRCDKLLSIPVEMGHLGLFCKTSCEKCDYYKSMQLNH